MEASDRSGTVDPIELFKLDLTGPNAIESIPRSIRSLFARLGTDGDDAALVAYELAANAIKHGRPPAQLTVYRLADELRVQVTDTLRCELPQRAFPLDGETGRGLPLARVLSKFSWGLIGGLKYTRAEFALRAVPPPPGRR
jgi:anti-sigma regulatory factor (Ser/Thr protein kinase)